MVVDANSSHESKQEEETVTVSEKDLEEDYCINLANGKKNLLCNDFPEAVACFQAACSAQSERFGDTSPECAESFFLYGKSLLELARVENGVLGNALKGVPETEDSDSDVEVEQFETTKDLPDQEREKLRHDVEAAMATSDDNVGTSEEEASNVDNVQEKVGDDETTKETKDKEKLTTNEPTVAEATNLDETMEEIPPPTEEPSTSSGVTLDEEANEENIEDPNDIPNMQLAWEMLELAKVLYAKKPESDDTNLMIAQCHLKLGELGLEVENYSQAIDDFLQGLTLHKKMLRTHDRRLAETHYSLGLAYSFNKQHDDAIKHYHAALVVLESRIDFLNEMIDEKDGKEGKDGEVMEECAEVGEIKNLIPDINSKIEDVLVMKREESRVNGSQGETSIGFGSSSFKNASPVCSVIPARQGSGGSASSSLQSSSDISHLVRRKRPPTDESESTCKKAKEDTASDHLTQAKSNSNEALSVEEQKKPCEVVPPEVSTKGSIEEKENLPEIPT